MGFMDFLSKKSSKVDYAQEFKDAFENQDAGKISKIMGEWKEYNMDDANFGLAMVIMGSLNDNIKFNETFEIYLQVVQEKPDNPELFDWFNSTAISLIEKRCDEDIGFSTMFNNKYKSNQSSNNYAQEFLRLFEDIVYNDNADKLRELQDVVDVWEENCPQDANMHCAYVILNVLKLSKDELDGRVKKANEFTPVDKNAYSKLLAIMQGVCKAKL
jgi:hypothetical protein